MKRLSATCACSILLAVIPHARAEAQATTGLTAHHAMVWGTIGFQGDIGGSLNSSGIGHVGLVNAELDANTWGERYDAGLLIRAGIAYNLSQSAQVFLTSQWEQAEADEAPIGLYGGKNINAVFSDYQGWGIDVGYRHVFATMSRAKPFAEGAFGFQNLNEIHADMSTIDGSFVANNVPYYDDSWVAEWRLGGGVLWDLTPRIGLQATLDLKYSGVLSDKSGLGTLGFERVNNTGNRVTLPLLFGAYIKF